MARGGVEIEAVEFLQVGDALAARFAERELAVEGVKDDAFEQVAKSEVAVFGEGFQDFEQAFSMRTPVCTRSTTWG